jgi:hypothetical protein
MFENEPEYVDTLSEIEQEMKHEERERDKDRAGLNDLSLGPVEMLEYDLICPTSKRAIDEAAKLGMVVVFPKDNQLQIDIDNDESYAVFQAHLDILQHHFGFGDIEEHPSKSGGQKRHITVNLNADIDNTERVLLQALMGSDRKREFLELHPGVARRRSPSAVP